MTSTKRFALLAALAAAAPTVAQVNTPVTWAVLIGAENYADAYTGDAPYASPAASSAPTPLAPRS
jgi:hypothetical protein